MSQLVFQTRADDAYDVEIANVGTLAGGARGGVSVDLAKATLRELQDASGKPLTGKKLDDAAREFAEARGIDANSFKTIDEESLRVEAGAFPAGKTIEEFSREASERDYGAVSAAEAAAEAETTTADAR